MKRGTWVAIACVGVCLGLGLRPVDGIDRAAAWIVGVLGLPLQALGDAEVLVLGSSLKPDAARAASAAEARAAFRQRGSSLAAAAPAVAFTGNACAASVLSRDADDGTITIDRGAGDGLVPGLPVVSGEILVGAISAVERARSTVRLVTHRAFRVAALTDEPSPMRLVVAGAGFGHARVDLAERHDLPGGAALVVAASVDGSPLDAAAGRRIGILGLALEDPADAKRPGAKRRLRRIDPDRSVVPDLDPDRLLEVFVLAPADMPIGPPSGKPVDAVATTAAERWERIDLVPAGDPTPGRRSLLGRMPRSVDAEMGAALALDGWLLGRVARGGGPTIRVRLCEDPGFEVDGVLLLPEGAPIRLGALRCIGTEGGALVLALRSRPGDLPALSDGPLVTGNRERQVPPGLLIGFARVDAGRLLVDRPFRGADATSAQLFDLAEAAGK